MREEGKLCEVDIVDETGSYIKLPRASMRESWEADLGSAGLEHQLCLWAIEILPRDCLCTTMFQECFAGVVDRNLRDPGLWS